MKLSLVIPCYNEAENLPLLVERCAASMDRDDVEVILVDNGSTDASPEVLAGLVPQHRFARTVRVPENRGYGYGILSGLAAADGDILAWTHADMQTDPFDAIRGLELFAAAADPRRLFVKGRRYGRPFADVFFTMGMSLFETMLLRRRLWDINAQPTMFHRDFFAGWASPPHDFSLDLYAYYSARRTGLEVARFPVRFGERAHGQSHWNVDWKAKVRFIRRTVAYSRTLHRSIGSGT